MDTKAERFKREIREQAEASRELVNIEQPRVFWQGVYRACVNELIRALQAAEALEVEQAQHVLPALAEAAQLPEVDALRARVEADAANRPASWWADQ